MHLWQPIGASKQWSRFLCRNSLRLVLIYRFKEHISFRSARGFFFGRRALAEDPKIVLDGPISSWFISNNAGKVTIKDPISPTTKRPFWAEVRTPQSPIKKAPPGDSGVIFMLRERFPYAKVLAGIRKITCPKQNSCVTDLLIVVQWLRRRFAYFHSESVFGFLAYCIQHRRPTESDTSLASQSLIDLIQILVRRQPGLFVPHEVYNFAVWDLAKKGLDKELIGLLKVVGRSEKNRECALMVLRLLLGMWCGSNKSEVAAKFFVSEFIPSELYSQFQFSELAGDLMDPEFTLFVERLPQLYQAHILKDLVQLVKEKLRLGQLLEAFNLQRQLLDLDEGQTQRLMAASGEDVARELLLKWNNKPISSLHVRAFFLFPPTNAQCANMMKNINRELKRRILVGMRAPPDIADALLENVGRLGYSFDSLMYSSLVVMFCRMNDMTKAEEVLKAQCDAGLQPFDMTATIMMWGYARSGDVEQGLDLLDRLLRKGIKLNIFHLTQLIKLHALKPDGLSDVVNTIQTMEDMKLCPDVITFQIIIDAMIRFDRLDLLSNTLDKVANLGLSCDLPVFTSLITCFGREFDLPSLTYVITRVRDQGLTLTPDYMRHTLISAAHCKVPLGFLESNLGPALASQHRMALETMVIPYMRFFILISSKHHVLKTSVYRLLDAWAFSSSPASYPELIPLIDLLAQLIYKLEDFRLLALVWYVLGRHFSPHSDETESAFHWALHSISTFSHPNLKMHHCSPS